MRKIVRRMTLYRCAVCKTDYRSKAMAKECESYPVECRKFRRGTRVRALESRRCVCSRKYIADGIVLEVLGPTRADEEYSKKWLNSEGSDAHVFVYIVEFVTPCCKRKNSAVYYGAELKPL